ncbi:MAG: VCBS repeat-containing protein [Gemmatimonadota bacterium]|nr:VCBS repeat-containing protein [Gemmatimonadota bacterium]
MRFHVLAHLTTSFLILSSMFSLALGAEIEFVKHTIKPPRAGAQGNTVPSMVWLEDIDSDGQIDLVASHVAWIDEEGYVYPYTAWYKGPEFKKEYIIVDKNSFGPDCRIYRFVMYDVDGDGRKDLIGQGYQPFSNYNHWYRCPQDPTQPWTQSFDYGRDLDNGHDIRLRDIDKDGRMDIILLDSWSGKMIYKTIPAGEASRKHWPFQTITTGTGFTHYMSFYDVNRDGREDIIIAKEEDGGEGIRWYENPGRTDRGKQWREHFIVDANFLKAIARDLDGDGDIDFIGSGEGYETGDMGWYETTGGGCIFHEFDIVDNENDIIGGHNCELVDVDGDGDEDLIVGGVDKKDNCQRFRWYEYTRDKGSIRWIEHVFGITSIDGFVPAHGFYCGEMAWGDMDGDGDRDFVYAGSGSGFLGWFENRVSDSDIDIK